MDTTPWAAASFDDVFVSIVAGASFEDVAQCGALTNFPQFLSLGQLLSKPTVALKASWVWRRELHSRLGVLLETLETVAMYEFWLRCLVQGEALVKSPAVNSTYFEPQGFRGPTRDGFETRNLEKAKRIYEDRIRATLSQSGMPGLGSTLYRHNRALIKSLGSRP